MKYIIILFNNNNININDLDVFNKNYSKIIKEKFII